MHQIQVSAQILLPAWFIEACRQGLGLVIRPIGPSFAWVPAICQTLQPGHNKGLMSCVSRRHAKWQLCNYFCLGTWLNADFGTLKFRCGTRKNVFTLDTQPDTTMAGHKTLLPMFLGFSKNTFLCTECNFMGRPGNRLNLVQREIYTFWVIEFPI